MESTYNTQRFSAENSTENSNLFRQISLKVSKLGASVGIKIIPFHNPNLPSFSKLSLLQQKNVLKSLKTYLNIYESVAAEGSSILNSSRVVWNALLQLGYRPTSDLFAYIRDEHLIEIHDNNLVQIFRNLSFFNYCTYSLEDLYCNHLTDLYTRDEKLEKELIQIVTKIYSGQVDQVIDPQLQPHVIEEKASANKYAVFCHIQNMAPLFSNSESNGAAIATLTIEFAETFKTPERSAEVIPLSSFSANAKANELPL